MLSLLCGCWGEPSLIIVTLCSLEVIRTLKGQANALDSRSGSDPDQIPVLGVEGGPVAQAKRILTLLARWLARPELTVRLPRCGLYFTR